MADFEVGDGTRFPLLSLPVGVVAEVARFGHPAVALAEEADEEGLDPVNPLPAVLPGVGGLAVEVLGRDAPAQVHVEELQPQLFHPLAQLREYDRDQMVSLGMHIPKG